LIEHEDKSINMDALKHGDQVELVRMVDLYSDSIYRIALRMLNNPADAEDVLQETFIKAFRALPGDGHGHHSRGTRGRRLGHDRKALRRIPHQRGVS